MDTTRPYKNMTTIHSLAFIGIAAAAVILNGAGMLDTIERQLILLAVLLPFAGIPHGSLDYSIARDMLAPRLSRLWSMTFLTAYLTLMLAVLLAWQANPTASLAAFLGITAFHFGTGDTLSTAKIPFVFRIADMVGRGGGGFNHAGIFLCRRCWFAFFLPDTFRWSAVVDQHAGDDGAICRPGSPRQYGLVWLSICRRQKNGRLSTDGGTDQHLGRVLSSTGAAGLYHLFYVSAFHSAPALRCRE